MSDDEFLEAFEACRIPSVDWTHAAHVRMAWLYLTLLGEPEALEKVRGGIRRYNASLGGDGYHETITVGFVRLIAARLRGGAPGDFASFRRDNPDLFDRPLAPLGRYWSADLLKSPAAKDCFVPPDREPLP